MKKIMLLMLISILTLLSLTSCEIVSELLGSDPTGNVTNSECEHEWLDATCISPKTCAKCSKTEGGVTSDHNYTEATCEAPMTCRDCGIVFGRALGHKYTPATCYAPKTCSTCNDVVGYPVHDYTAATCTEPQICTKCNSVYGTALGHNTQTILTEPTCTSDGSEELVCSACEFTEVTTVIPMIKHEDIPFKYNGDTTTKTDGTVTSACPHCDYSVTETLVGSSKFISEAFAGKKISILGDSISTYLSYSSDLAALTTNSNVFSNIVWSGYTPLNSTFGGSSVDSTWWKRTIDALGADLLVNNSNSGESVFNALIDRCMQLHDNTGSNAGETPDIILVYLGTNDNLSTPGSASTLNMEKIKKLSEDMKANQNLTPKNLAEAYAVMLYRIKETYPDAEIYCLTNLERSDHDVSMTHSTSQVIRDVAALFEGIYIADIEKESGITRDNPDYEKYMPADSGGKNLHPGVEGMKEIARVVLETIIENSRYMPEEFYELFPDNCE